MDKYKKGDHIVIEYNTDEYSERTIQGMEAKGWTIVSSSPVEEIFVKVVGVRIGYKKL